MKSTWQSFLAEIQQAVNSQKIPQIFWWAPVSLSLDLEPLIGWAEELLTTLEWRHDNSLTFIWNSDEDKNWVSHGDVLLD